MMNNTKSFAPHLLDSAQSGVSGVNAPLSPAATTVSKLRLSLRQTTMKSFAVAALAALAPPAVANDNGLALTPCVPPQTDPLTSFFCPPPL